MNNHAVARQNMLDCQLLTNGIVMPELIDAFAKIPREDFLPEGKKGSAYIDEELTVGENAFCLEPLVQARIIQALEPENTNAVLNIGDMTGYSSAILSGLVSTAVVLETPPGILDNARHVWDSLDCCNVVVVGGKAEEGSPEHAPYDRILINGAVPEVPQSLLNQLVSRGKLAAVITKPGENIGYITVIEKIENGKFSTRRFFNAATPYVPGFEPKSEFTF